MNITVIGGGNVGVQFAVHCAHMGHNVIIYTSQYKTFKNELSIVDENNKITLFGTIDCATYNPEIAFENADLIFITTPSFCIRDIAEKIIKYAKNNPPVIAVPGSGGAEYIFSSYKGDFFGLNKTPSVARLKVIGEKVCAVGYRNELFIGALKNKNIEKYSKLISELFNIKCSPLPCYMNITLTPSNQIIHTSRLYTMFKDYKDGVFYKTAPLIYEDWSDEASELLLNFDEELQNVVKSYKELDLSSIKFLKEHYESNTPKELTQKIRTIKGFKNILTPMVKVENGYIPDFQSRYFLADFPYGLSIIKQFAKLGSVKTPYIDKILDWYYRLQPNADTFDLKKYNINSKNDVIKFYSA